MRRLSILACVVAAGAVAVVPAGAGAAADCNGNVVDIGGLAYVDDRGDGNVWVYAESGAAGGLQSGGTHAVLGYPDDCDSGGNYDTLVY